MTHPPLARLDTVSNATSTGWRHIIVAPEIHAVARLGAGGYSLQTRFGLAAVSWAYDAATKQLHTNVTVPTGSTAEVVHEGEVPAVAATGAGPSSLHAVYEGERQVWGGGGGVQEERVATTIGSGEWAFVSHYI